MWNSLRKNWPLLLLIIAIIIVVLQKFTDHDNVENKIYTSSIRTDSAWVPPSLFTDYELAGNERALVIYGEDIIANTSRYFGPKGSVAQISNGMNCQNCHLNAGKKNWGNNYSAVYSTYPKFRARSGETEGIYKRVSDCFERSLNGSAPDSNSKEYKAIYEYMKWVGQGVQKGQKPVGSGIEQLPFLDRAASPEKGKNVYIAQCQTCHGADGQGKLNGNGTGYEYPPLWGLHSYNIGAGLFRLSSFAGYVKNNMPFNLASHNNPKLSTEEAWDVAAYVNSQPRPLMDIKHDWPDISKKPFDHPFGPYTDGFSEQQHKYGPFKSIVAKKSLREKN
jgi:thiosulfate dehydrogenase